MRKFNDEEIQKRSQLVGLCHNILLQYKEKRQMLNINWRQAFNQGGVDKVREFFLRTCNLVDAQVKTVTELLELVRSQEEEIKQSEKRIDKHLHFSELVRSHFNFAQATGDMFKKEELDAAKIIELLGQLKIDLDSQKKELDSAKKQGEGKQAYIEVNIQKLADTELKILQGITPFWNDWEILVPKIEELSSKLDSVDEESLERLRKQVQMLLGVYHSQFADDNRAPQLGTELALNLYLQPTQEIKDLGNKIPITIINIDMTACNKIDDSHQLGNKLIEYCYGELNTRLGRRSFTKIENGEGKMQNPGVVTVLGRTRFKIVGVPKHELEEALHDIPPVVRSMLKKTFGKKFGGIDQEKLENLNTRMLAGYHELEIGDERTRFGWLLVEKSVSVDGYLADMLPPYPGPLDKKVEQERIVGELKQLEKQIALKIDNAIKIAAAKAEYLEKIEYPEREGKTMAEIRRRKEAAMIPEVDSAIFKARVREIEEEVLNDPKWKFSPILIYDDTDKITPVWIGLNYIPEEEFEGKMIKRISHQMGFDNKLADELFAHFESARQKKIDGKLTSEDAAKLQELKQNFYSNVLQKRHIEKSYDLRFTAALREEAYDEIVSAMMQIEGPQVITFFELDGFNAFNKLYRPNSEDTYYHAVLKLIFEKFDEVFNNDFGDEYNIKPRMAKQGDEIWFSYPLHTERGVMQEDNHIKFLELVRQSLVSKNADEALTVPNLKTVSWIPYLIENKVMMILHAKNALTKNASTKDWELVYADNSKYFSDRPLSSRRPLVTLENIETLMGGFFTAGSFLRMNKKEDFKDWKSLVLAREVTGEGKFGPLNFKYSSLLFDETVKQLDKENNSSRLKTGRVIRLGTTAGYAGFRKPIMCGDAKAMNHIRTELNHSVEQMRDKPGKGRGGLYNLEEEGFKFV